VLPTQPRVKLPVRSQRKDRTLICGWRRDIDDMISSLDAEVKEGSELHLLCELSVEEREQRLFNGNMGELKNLRLVHHVGNPAVRRVLEALPLASYHYVLVLADGETYTRCTFEGSKLVETEKPQSLSPPHFPFHEPPPSSLRVPQKCERAGRWTLTRTTWRPFCCFATCGAASASSRGPERGEPRPPPSQLWRRQRS